MYFSHKYRENIIISDAVHLLLYFLMDLGQFRIRNGHLNPQKTVSQIRIHNMTVVLFLYKSLKNPHNTMLVLFTKIHRTNKLAY
jgi:hypothetical protein